MIKTINNNIRAITIIQSEVSTINSRLIPILEKKYSKITYIRNENDILI